MSKLYFVNPGEIDIRAVTTLGVNVKQGENPFGHFGTGLKYAIAGILRLGGSIVIWSGTRRYEFLGQEADIRGKSFRIVNMLDQGEFEGDGGAQPLGFTTDLGRDWQPWMIYRELKSNALDEGGDLAWLDADREPQAGRTVIEVDCEELWQAHMKQGEFWVDATQQRLLWAGYGLEVYDGASSALFYHGIKATNSEAGLTARWAWVYNITGHLALTEDRTLASFYDARTLIAKALARCDNVEVLERVLGNEAECQGFDFDHWDIEASPEFMQVVLERVEKKLNVPESARDLVKRSKPEELEEAELDIPSSYEEMLRRAPEDALVVKESYYSWKVENDERMAGLEQELKYWKACAKKLGGQS